MLFNNLDRDAIFTTNRSAKRSSVYVKITSTTTSHPTIMNDLREINRICTIIADKSIADIRYTISEERY